MEPSSTRTRAGPRMPVAARVTVALWVAVVALIAGCAGQPGGPTHTSGRSPAPSPTGADPAGVGRVRDALPPPSVGVRAEGRYSWAMLDRRSGAWYSSANSTGTGYSESMIKVWLAADLLSRAASRGARPSAARLEQLSRMIRDSDDAAADAVWVANGTDSGIRRLVKVCGLRDTKVAPGSWSRTMISAQDAVRLGACIADGTAAGPVWTDWLLAEMREVRGSTSQQPWGGRWGIIDALDAQDAATLAMKNGWTYRSDGAWHVNCLGVHDDWVLAIMTTYPGSRGLPYGAGLCQVIARQALAPGD